MLPGTGFGTTECPLKELCILKSLTRLYLPNVGIQNSFMKDHIFAHFFNIENVSHVFWHIHFFRFHFQEFTYFTRQAIYHSTIGCAIYSNRWQEKLTSWEPPSYQTPCTFLIKLLCNWLNAMEQNKSCLLMLKSTLVLFTWCIFRSNGSGFVNLFPLKL